MSIFQRQRYGQGCQKTYETSIDKENGVVITVVPMIVVTEFDIRVLAVKHEWAAQKCHV